jgi:epoxyqueuosine reductase
MITTSRLTLAALSARARALGFDAVGVTSAAVPALWGERLAMWLELGRHGEMAWMAETRSRRVDPRALWSEAKSVIMLAVNYGPDDDPLEVTRQSDKAAISVYARHRDYHDVIKGRLKTLGSWLAAQAPGIELKVFVDTAPVMEKPLAAAAGLGWQGKHTNLVSREFGSWLFLGAIFVNVELEANAAEQDHCGSCRACLDACPTNAFPAPYQLDARRCISYLTIENPGPIPREFRAAIGNRIYGCDDCLAVCPWNKFASLGREAKLAARDDLKRPALAELAALEDAGFRALFAGGPIKRIGHARFLRNVMIAAGNSGDATLLPAVRKALGAASPLVRGAAVWALARLAAEEARGRAGTVFAREADEDVRAEWSAILISEVSC